MRDMLRAKIEKAIRLAPKVRLWEHGENSLAATSKRLGVGQKFLRKYVEG